MRRKASKKSRSVPGSRSAVVREQVVWETKSVQTPSDFIGRRRLSTVLVISTISSFFFVLTVMVFIVQPLLAHVCGCMMSRRIQAFCGCRIRNYITNSRGFIAVKRFVGTSHDESGSYSASGLLPVLAPASMRLQRAVLFSTVNAAGKIWLSR